MSEPIAHLKIGEFLDNKFSGVVAAHPFWHFEPWDVEKRSDDVLRIAKDDGVDLYDGNLVSHTGRDPHPFQTGYLLSTAKFRTLLAASRVGKTVAAFVELAIQASGERPVALSLPKGEKSTVKRLVTPDNIRRFGRFDSRTETFIDHNVDATKPEGWEEWDCGYIVGAGVYPAEKIAPAGSVLWVGTTHKALWEFWWPRFTNARLNLFPDEFIDKNHGFDGVTKSEWTIHAIRDCRITIISYESDPRSFEAIDTWSCVFDEESPQKGCVTAAVNHTRFFSNVMTPYNGMTYTRKLIFDENKDPANNQVFHATSYDSPYLTREMIDHRRSVMEKWEIGARIWGFHTEAKGKPYFDRAKINIWVRKFKHPYTLVRFSPNDPYDGVVTRPGRELPGLMSVSVRGDTVEEENQCDTWRVYEEHDEKTAYYLMADSAEGSDIPSEAGDVLASLVMRFPRLDNGEKFPMIVASLRSTLKTANFARVCGYALRYYNNALLCGEGPARGSYNALFYAELQDYPYWFLQTSVRDSTRKSRSTKGFDTNAATRHALFNDVIREVLDEYTVDEDPLIRDESLLVELSSCVVAVKNGARRPDHTDHSTLDTTICYGQGLYIWKHYANQVKSRYVEKPKQMGPITRLLMQNEQAREKSLWLGANVSDLR